MRLGRRLPCRRAAGLASGPGRVWGLEAGRLGREAGPGEAGLGGEAGRADGWGNETGRRAQRLVLAARSGDSRDHRRRLVATTGWLR